MTKRFATRFNQAEIEAAKSLKSESPVRSSELVRLHVAEKPTTGSKWADRMVNEAVDCALLRLKPIIRDELRKEIKRLLQIEETE